MHTAGCQITMASTNTLGLDAVSSSFPFLFSLILFQCSLPCRRGCFVSSEAMSRRLDPPCLPASLAPSAPPGFTPLSGSASKVGTKGSQLQADTMHSVHGQSGMNRVYTVATGVHGKRR